MSGFGIGDRILVHCRENGRAGTWLATVTGIRTDAAGRFSAARVRDRWGMDFIVLPGVIWPWPLTDRHAGIMLDRNGAVA